MTQTIARPDQSLIEAHNVYIHGVNANGAKLYRVPSHTQEDVEYIVAVYEGQTSCDCPAGFYRGQCRHQRQVVAFLADEARRERQRLERDTADARRMAERQLPRAEFGLFLLRGGKASEWQGAR